jgi:hypothetical protein
MCLPHRILRELGLTSEALSRAAMRTTRRRAAIAGSIGPIFASPHFRDSDVARAALRNLAALAQSTAYGVPDGGALVVDGSQIELFGEVVAAP